MKMSETGSEEDSRTKTVVRRKRDERNSSGSSGSSPDIPPTKSAKTQLIEKDDNVWIMLKQIRRKTDELLEENRALRKQYEELKWSTEFNNSQLESLKQENKKLKGGLVVWRFKPILSVGSREHAYVFWRFTVEELSCVCGKS